MLQDTNINHTLVKVVKSNDITSTIKVGNKVSEPYRIKGLRKGCRISPTLFKIYVMKAPTHWKKKFKEMGTETDLSLIHI